MTLANILADMGPSAPVLTLTLVVGLSCANGSPGRPDAAQARVAEGQWGGERVRLEVTDSGATIEFDCAHGKIEEPLTLDSAGRFDTRGTYKVERPGPVREDESDGDRVRYRGTVSGGTMTLTISPENGEKAIGTFTLERGKKVAIRKCL
jgi:hypothetical protein